MKMEMRITPFWEILKATGIRKLQRIIGNYSKRCNMLRIKSHNIVLQSSKMESNKEQIGMIK
jgi:hypothetical protein